jgi:hypothetical protein
MEGLWGKSVSKHGPHRLARYPNSPTNVRTGSLTYPLAYSIEVAVEEEISEELSEETWLSEKAIEKAIEETIMESNEIVETMQEAIEEHRADVEDAVKEANVPSCGQGGARTWADVTDATLADLVADLVADDESLTAGGAQSSAALTAPVPASFWLEATTEAILADLVAGEEAIGLHDIPPAQATETAAGLEMAQHEHVTAAGVQQVGPEWLTAFNSELDEDGRERQETALPTPERLGHGQGCTTPGQQALHVARQCMQSPHTDAEICQVVSTLAVALGANRTEAGTIKALHAVLLLLHRPEMSQEEACTSTGASRSNFKRWRKRVQSAQLGASLP